MVNIMRLLIAFKNNMCAFDALTLLCVQCFSIKSNLLVM